MGSLTALPQGLEWQYAQAQAGNPIYANLLKQYSPTVGVGAFAANMAPSWAPMADYANWAAANPSAFTPIANAAGINAGVRDTRNLTMAPSAPPEYRRQVITGDYDGNGAGGGGGLGAGGGVTRGVTFPSANTRGAWPGATSGRTAIPGVASGGGYGYQPNTTINPANYAYTPYTNPNTTPFMYPLNTQNKEYTPGWGTNVSGGLLNYLQPSIQNAQQNYLNQSGVLQSFLNQNSPQSPYSQLMNILSGLGGGGGGIGANYATQGTGTSAPDLVNLLLQGYGQTTGGLNQGVPGILNQIINQGLPNQAAVGNMTGQQLGFGAGMQANTANTLQQALAQGGLSPEYVSAMRNLVLQPQQEALAGQLNQMGGGIAAPSSGLFQELQRRNEANFSNALVQAGMGNYANLLGQAGALGQGALGTGLAGYGAVANAAYPYISLAGGMGTQLANMGQTGNLATASQYQNLLSTLLGTGLTSNQQALQSYLGQLSPYTSLAQTGLQGDTELAKAQYQADYMANLAKMQSIGIVIQNILKAANNANNTGGGAPGGANQIAWWDWDPSLNPYPL